MQGSLAMVLDVDGYCCSGNSKCACWARLLDPPPHSLNNNCNNNALKMFVITTLPNVFIYSCLCSPRMQRSKKQQSSSGVLSLSLGQAATPRKALSFSAVNTPVNSNSGSVSQESNVASDASLLSSILDQSNLRKRTVTTTTTFTSTSVDGHWGQLQIQH